MSDRTIRRCRAGSCSPPRRAMDTTGSRSCPPDRANNLTNISYRPRNAAGKDKALGFCAISITIALSDLRALGRELQVLVETVF